MITRVEIVFENCEYLKLSSKDIRSLSLDNIQKYAYAYNLPHFDDQDKEKRTKRLSDHDRGSV